jgi:hypothetical protein
VDFAVHGEVVRLPVVHLQVAERPEAFLEQTRSRAPPISTLLSA